VHIKHEELVHTALNIQKIGDGRNCVLTFNTYEGNLQNSEGNMRKSV
jgi:hypothetical protein